MDNTSEIQNAIAFFKRCGVPYADTALAALQEQAERGKGCEYCDPEVMSGNPIFSRHADGYLGNGKFCTDAGVGVKAYFCPHCGRRLK